MAVIVLIVMTALVVASIILIGTYVSESTSWSLPSVVGPPDTFWISLIYWLKLW
jgi:hypothetical protein